jgi:hypothetical protein
MRRGRDSEGFMPHCELGAGKVLYLHLRELLGKASRGAAQGGGGTAQVGPPR